MNEGSFEQAFPVRGGDFSQAGEASSKIKNILKRLGIRYDIIKRVAIASYEAEINIVAYADEGELKVQIDPRRIAVTATDRGQGIADIELAMKEGYSTATPQLRELGFGAGMGLPNQKKAADEMSIESIVGKGTTVILKFSLDENGTERQA
jgi:serine/threonine-protein kinase RsbT